jgi:hypothetical protein
VLDHHQRVHRFGLDALLETTDPVHRDAEGELS